MSWTRKLLALTLAVSFCLAIGLIVLELLFGGWFRSPNGWRAADQLNLIRDQVINYDVSKIYGQGAPPVKYSRDQYGLRDTCLDPADIEIITIGGSTTDQRFIPDGQTWQDELQVQLRQRSGEEAHCVSNAGVDGHSTYGHIASFDRWFPLIPNFAPETYIIYVGINDAGFREGPSAFDESTDTSWRTKSALWRIKRSLEHAWQSRQGVAEDRVYAGHSTVKITPNLYTATSTSSGVSALIQSNAQKFERNIEQLLEMIRDADGTPVCVSQPHQFVKTIDGERRGAAKVFTHNGHVFNGLDYDESLRALNDVLEEACPANGGRYINLTDAAFHADDYYDWVHMTPKGARKIGLILADELLTQSSDS